MNLPICGFDAKNALLCPQCEARLGDGSLSRSDVDASIKLARLAKESPEIDGFTLFSCAEIGANVVIALDKSDIRAIRQSRTLYGLIRAQFEQKIWLVGAGEGDERFIGDLFFPTKVLSVNTVWAPGGARRAKAVISGRRTSKFPIDTDQVVRIVKDARNIDIEIEFEEQAVV